MGYFPLEADFSGQVRVSEDKSRSDTIGAPIIVFLKHCVAGLPGAGNNIFDLKPALVGTGRHGGILAQFFLDRRLRKEYLFGQEGGDYYD